eukprot:3734332-Lingulodinium_polyedra.AAC.1
MPQVRLARVLFTPGVERRGCPFAVRRTSLTRGFLFGNERIIVRRLGSQFARRQDYVGAGQLIA